MIHAVNILPDADLGAVGAALSLLGTVTTPHPRTPRYVLVEAPAEAAEAIGNVEGVCNCGDPDHPVELAEVAEQALGPDQWNLGYITNPVDHSKFRYDAAGEGVTICNVDTPAENISDFGSRFEKVYDPHGVPNTQTHGTKTLCVAGGDAYGVARKALLRNFAGFTGAGAATTATINAAISDVCDYVEDFPTPNGAVLSLSILTQGFLLANPFTAVIDRAVSLGIVVIAASGNGAGPNNDAINFETSTTKGWPALDPDAITVGSHDKNGAWSWFSNYPVDIHAPGYQYDIMGPGNIVTLSSGTSYSCPMVAGLVAIALSEGVSDVRQWLADNATAITGVQGGSSSSAQLPVEGVALATILLSGGGPGNMPNPRRLIYGGGPGSIYNPANVIDERNFHV